MSSLFVSSLSLEVLRDRKGHQGMAGLRTTATTLALVDAVGETGSSVADEKERNDDIEGDGRLTSVHWNRNVDDL